MPDTRRHRGAHPDDTKLFAAQTHDALRLAVAELSWLLTRGYAAPSSLKLVGDRHSLTERQRTAVMRCACCDEARRSRLSRQLQCDQITARAVAIDGYNVLTTVETALAGGVVLAARDTCFRDIASIHGTWRKVEETVPAIGLVGLTLNTLRAGPTIWFLDKPVSNSGRLAAAIRQIASEHQWDWTVRIVPDADRALGQCGAVVASADSVVLDRCERWVNLARCVVESHVPAAKIVDLCASCG